MTANYCRRRTVSAVMEVARAQGVGKTLHPFTKRPIETIPTIQSPTILAFTDGGIRHKFSLLDTGGNNLQTLLIGNQHRPSMVEGGVVSLLLQHQIASLQSYPFVF